MSTPKRCAWTAKASPKEVSYHDEEWGVPSYDDRHLFEMLILEGAQAGLSWSTILKKRESYRKAFDGFDAERMAGYPPERVEALLGDPGIVRNRLKVGAAITNAQSYLHVLEIHGGFADYLWQFVDGFPLQNRWRHIEEVPVSTSKSDAMSKELRRLGFKFVGTTICYAFMQAVGMVNDHTVDCFRHLEVAKMSS